eukprot:749351-Hanusia_phi.AAC.8
MADLVSLPQRADSQRGGCFHIPVESLPRAERECEGAAGGREDDLCRLGGGAGHPCVPARRNHHPHERAS